MLGADISEYDIQRLVISCLVLLLHWRNSILIAIESTVLVLAIDTSAVGFNIAQAALDLLTGGKAVALGRVEVVAEQVPASGCGI